MSTQAAKGPAVKSEVGRSRDSVSISYRPADMYYVMHQWNHYCRWAQAPIRRPISMPTFRKPERVPDLQQVGLAWKAVK